MAMFDSVLRAMGVSTQSEINDARLERNQVTYSAEPRDQFASAVADTLSKLEPHAAVRAFPALRDVQIKGDENVVWGRIAKAAHGVADESASRPVQSLDAPLSRAVGERALSEAARTIHESARTRFEPGQRIESILGAKREMVSTQTRAFMSQGTAAERNAQTQASDMFYNGNQSARHSLGHDVGDVVGKPTSATQRDWLLEATRARMAAAQVGALSPKRTVEAAMDASTQGHMVEGAIAQTPNRANAQRLQGPERAALIRGQMDRNAAPAPSMRQHAAEKDQAAARDGIVATTTSGPSKADRAAAHAMGGLRER